MSYSFSVKAPNREAAIDQAYFELNKVADRDAPHRFDVKAAQTAVAAFINTLGDDDSLDVAVSMSGSVSVQGRQGEPQSVTNVGTSISVSQVSRPLKVG
jgi:hypothetical protein